MVKLGYMMNMVFIKDPEQHAQNVVIKGMYADKVWVMYVQSGKDEILDTVDIGFSNPVQDEIPTHTFIVKDAEDNWVLWDHEEGFWYECNDPTQPTGREITEAEMQAHQGYKGKTLH